MFKKTITSKQVADGAKVPSFFGIAYYDLPCDNVVCCPLGFNVLVGLIVLFYRWLKTGVDKKGAPHFHNRALRHWDEIEKSKKLYNPAWAGIGMSKNGQQITCSKGNCSRTCNHKPEFGDVNPDTQG